MNRAAPSRLPLAALLGVAAACLCAGSCDKPVPVTPAAGIYAVNGQATLSWGLKKKPTERRAQPGALLMSNMTVEVEKGVVLEAFDGTFVWLPSGKHKVSALKLPVGAPEGAVRPIVVVAAEATRKDIPPPVVMVRYEPAPAKAIEVGTDADLKADMSFFFTPHKDPSELPEEPRPPPESPWKMKDKYVHALHRPVKVGDGVRTLAAADGAVVVEFLDKATAFASTLKLPIDLFDVKRVVVVEGSAKLTLPAGKTLELKSGDIAEIEPLP